MSNYKPHLDRKVVQTAMKRALFFLMDGTAIFPLLLTPLMFSMSYLKFLAGFFVVMMIVAATGRGPVELIVYLIAKNIKGNNAPIKSKHQWKPSNRV
ncbi:hypothetical protein F7Q91_03355 [Vibrio chagasii]|uniref:Uncharacterized protein n=1 Tax=Vibrio chagasii TaxID=170679 RepID=A0A7V7TI06_9VIBR|nr:hypothetical protein [Vibrio chagasii]KAB0482459.1 hypothetical protein F7Q91_03355 [Vibrio chagasii]